MLIVNYSFYKALVNLKMELVISPSHQWPKQGIQMMIAFVGFFVGYAWQIISQTQGKDLHISVSILMCINLAFLFTIPNLVVQIFLKLISTQSKQQETLVKKCRMMSSNFEEIQKAFSFFFLIFFSSSQFMIIFQIFLTFQFTNLPLNFVLQSFSSTGLQIFSMILTLMATTSSVEEALEVLITLRKEIQLEILNTDDDKYLKQLAFWKTEIEMLKPINAAGYFEIDKTTLTSMMSVRFRRF